VVLELEKAKLQRMDYRTLMDLALSKNIRVLEAKGLDMRRGIRFRKDGRDWIAVDSDLPMNEKTRALGFLLKEDPRFTADAVEKLGEFGAVGTMTPVLTLCC
jgi:hypothetical protein